MCFTWLNMKYGFSGCLVPVFTYKGNVYLYTISLWFYHQIKTEVKDEIKLSNFLLFFISNIINSIIFHI